MRIYHYDPKTGELLSENAATKSPRDGRPLIPRFATAIEPPEAGENQAAVFDPKAGAWSLVPDFRGESYFTNKGRRVVIQGLGEKVPLGSPPDGPPVEMVSPEWDDVGWVDAYKPGYKEQRKAAILAVWSVEDQLEALVEAQMGDTTKLNDLTAHVAAVKEAYPKKEAKEKAL